MADTESLLEAGRRLARDLRAIRRSQSIDVKEVLDATRLADDVIEQLEETALMGNPMFNRVYLRSMFSSYASVLGIKQADMMSALEEAMSGQYSGLLSTNYLGPEKEGQSEEPIALVPNHDAKGAEKENSEAEAVAPETEPETQSETETATTANTESVQPSETESQTDNQGQDNEEVPEPGTGSDTDAEATKKDVQKIIAVPEPLVSEVKTATSSPGRTVLLPNMSGFLILVVAGIALVSLIWFAVSWVMSPKGDPEEDVVAQDTTVIDSRVRPDRVILSDTIGIDLIAYTEALDPIRVKLDKDLRKPYWIEHTDTLYFEMIDRVEFEREVDHARILIDGFAVPLHWYANSERAEITREKTQSWLDSLTSAGAFPPRSVVSEAIKSE